MSLSSGAGNSECISYLFDSAIALQYCMYLNAKKNDSFSGLVTCQKNIKKNLENNSGDFKAYKQSNSPIKLKQDYDKLKNIFDSFGEAKCKKYTSLFPPYMCDSVFHTSKGKSAMNKYLKDTILKDLKTYLDTDVLDSSGKSKPIKNFTETPPSKCNKQLKSIYQNYTGDHWSGINWICDGVTQSGSNCSKMTTKLSGLF